MKHCTLPTLFSCKNDYFTYRTEQPFRPKTAKTLVELLVLSLFKVISPKTILHYHGKCRDHGKCREHKWGDVKKFPSKYDISFNMKKKKEEAF